jgi:hypothetical protein
LVQYPDGVICFIEEATTQTFCERKWPKNEKNKNKKSKLENISKKLVDKSLEKTGCHQKSVRMTLYCSHTVMVGVLPCKAGTI